jgi:hypothetical protein
MPTRTITRRLWHFWLAGTIVGLFAGVMLLANALFFASLLPPSLTTAPATATVAQLAAGPHAIERVAAEPPPPPQREPPQPPRIPTVREGLPLD